MNLHFNLTCLQRKKAAIHYGWTSSSQHNHREKTWSSVKKNQRRARNSKLPTQRQEIYLCKMIHIFFCLTLHAASLKKWMLGYLPLLYQYFFSTAFLKFEYLPSISNQDSKLTNWLNSSKVPIFSRWSLVVPLSFSVLRTSTKARADAYSAVSGCTIRWKPIAFSSSGVGKGVTPPSSILQTLYSFVWHPIYFIVIPWCFHKASISSGLHNPSPSKL